MVVNGDHEDTDRIYDEYQNRRTYHHDTYTKIELKIYDIKEKKKFIKKKNYKKKFYKKKTK